jgi:hypothetical protein
MSVSDIDQGKTPGGPLGPWGGPERRRRPRPDGTGASSAPARPWSVLGPCGIGNRWSLAGHERLRPVEENRRSAHLHIPVLGKRSRARAGSSPTSSASSTGMSLLRSAEGEVVPTCHAEALLELEHQVSALAEVHVVGDHEVVGDPSGGLEGGLLQAVGHLVEGPPGAGVDADDGQVAAL